MIHRQPPAVEKVYGSLRGGCENILKIWKRCNFLDRFALVNCQWDIRKNQTGFLLEPDLLLFYHRILGQGVKISLLLDVFSVE